MKKSFLQARKLKNAGFVVLLLSLLVLSINSYAQKGTGSRTGIAREGIQSELITFTGKIIEMNDGPCISSTGRYNSGSHLILEVINNNQINIHVGPTQEVAYIINKLSIGDKIQVMSFKTPDLKINHYIAKEIKTKDENYVIRDESLRPFWAGRW